MLFSSEFDITRRRDDDWFDCVLVMDTKLFIDPFLIFKEMQAPWADAHAELIAYFNRCFALVAKAGGKRESPYYQKALSLLRFPEPREFCLGYVAEGTAGAGGGQGCARQIVGAMQDAIDRGIKSLDHFEELGILNERIGPDRISDMACNILRPRFIAYTQEVARRHQVQVEEFELAGGEFDSERCCWRTRKVHLPRNKCADRPVLLVPQRFLRDLPVLNAEDWFYSTEASQLRADLNIDIMERVEKRRIVEIAREHAPEVRAWVQAREQEPAKPYDLDRDPLGRWRWATEAEKYVSSHPLTLAPPADEEGFLAAIRKVIDEFGSFIEDRRGWKLLWNDNGKPKDEEAAQLAFHGVARLYCASNNIVVDREVELGRGPVDFKFSNGFRLRALLEVKKAENGKFWNGLEAQLPSYLQSEDCRFGWFLVIRFSDTKQMNDRVTRLEAKPHRVLEQNGKTRELWVEVVDARPKKSASKLEVKKNEARPR